MEDGQSEVKKLHRSEEKQQQLHPADLRETVSAEVK